MLDISYLLIIINSRYNNTSKSTRPLVWDEENILATVIGQFTTTRFHVAGSDFC